MDLSWPALLGLVSALWGGAPADIDSTPKTLLEAIYGAPAAEKRLADAEIYSARLRDLLVRYESEQAVTLAAAALPAPPVDLIPFDPLSRGTAPQNHVVIAEPAVRDHQATATVTIDRAEGPVQLSVFLVEDAQGWRVDDVASFDAKGQPWLLSWLLRYDPQSAE